MSPFATPFDAPSPDTVSTPVPLEQLVIEAYGGAGPDTQKHILAKLVGKVFETAPAHVQTRLLEQLLRPMGFMPLILVADGLFAKIRFRGGWANPLLRPVDLQAVRPNDVVALAEQVLQTSGTALNGLLHLLLHSPALAGSGAATVLMALLLQNLPRRKSSATDGSEQRPQAQQACAL